MEVDDPIEDTTLYLLTDYLGGEPLDDIERGSSSPSGVKTKSLMPFAPSTHPGMLVVTRWLRRLFFGKRISPGAGAASRAR